MENASKALVMAGTILISLMIITALVLSYNSFSNYEKSKEETKDTKLLENFNNQYEIYNRKNIKGTDIISVVNKAQAYNLQNENINPITVNIDFKGKKSEFSFTTEKNELILYSQYNGNFSKVINEAKIAESNLGGKVAAFKLASDIHNLEEHGKINSTLYKKNVYRYYEYVQLKKARFDCTKIEYDKQQRVNKLSFEFTGSFN